MISAMLQHDVLEAIQETASIPTMPQVATRFIEMTAQGECDFDDLVDLLCTDAGITGELLRLANSALFGLSRKVSSLKQAMVLLGLRKVRSLVLSRYLVEQMDRLRCPWIDHAHYWRRTVTSGALAARFSTWIDPALREEAFVAGLLADSGIMVLAQSVPELYEPIARDYELLHSPEWLARERHRLGVGHAEVSAMVLEHWCLPHLIVEAVRGHHNEDPYSAHMTPERKLSCLVRASDHISRLLCGIPDRNRVGSACSTIMERAGLSTPVLMDSLLDLEGEIQDISNLLHLEVIPNKAYEIICAQLTAQIAAADE